MIFKVRLRDTSTDMELMQYFEVVYTQRLL